MLLNLFLHHLVMGVHPQDGIMMVDRLTCVVSENEKP